MNCWELFKRNLVWRIGDGENTKFWIDHWLLGIAKLEDFALVDLTDEDLDMSVSQFVTETGDWNTNWLDQLLPSDFVDLFSAVKVPEPSLGCDSVAWLPEASGVFTIKSAFENIISQRYDNGKLFKEIWKVQVPQRVRSFLWLLARESLLMNVREEECPRILCARFVAWKKRQCSIHFVTAKE